jgi:hypothetical protein
MLHYPPSMTKLCEYCKATVVLERQGSGRPLEGRLDYWYTTDHRCLDGDAAIRIKEAEIARLEELSCPKSS